MLFYSWMSLFMDRDHPHDLPTFFQRHERCAFSCEMDMINFSILYMIVIRYVKMHYRKTLIHRFLDASKRKRATKAKMKQVATLDAIHILHLLKHFDGQNCYQFYEITLYYCI